MKCLHSWQAISDRIISARVTTRLRFITTIKSYAPREVADPIDKENFCDQLYLTLQNVHKGDLILFLGAKIATDNSSYESIMGKHRMGNMNENEKSLAETCLMFDVVISDSSFLHKRYAYIYMDIPGYAYT